MNETQPAEPIDFRPSDINLIGSFPPFVASFDKTECECAVFYIVRALAARSGDEWQPIRWTEISEVFKASIRLCEMMKKEAPPLDQLTVELASNPFARPDFHKLVALGYARWHGGDEDKNRPIEITEKGMERLRKWVKR